jgi:NADH:ubiquinone oxidoreductase subunit 6 (subunit J)
MNQELIIMYIIIHFAGIVMTILRILIGFLDEKDNIDKKELFLWILLLIYLMINLKISLDLLNCLE